MGKLSGLKIQNCGRRLSWPLGYTEMAITFQLIGDMFSCQKYYINPITKQQIYMLKTVGLNTLVTMTLVSDVENSKK